MWDCSWRLRNCKRTFRTFSRFPFRERFGTKSNHSKTKTLSSLLTVALLHETSAPQQSTFLNFPFDERLTFPFLRISARLETTHPQLPKLEPTSGMLNYAAEE